MGYNCGVFKKQLNSENPAAPIPPTPNPTTILTLKIIIKKEWFDQIAAGTKKVEYREVVPFWTSRLFDTESKRRKYDRIEFINGYNKDARRLITTFEGFTTRNNTYCIKIGKILK